MNFTDTRSYILRKYKTRKCKVGHVCTVHKIFCHCHFFIVRDDVYLHCIIFALLSPTCEPAAINLDDAVELRGVEEGVLDDPLGRHGLGFRLAGPQRYDPLRCDSPPRTGRLDILDSFLY